MSGDNWKHRDSNMRCNSCMWYSDEFRDIGRCHKHAPAMYGFPVVYNSSWCGDHKIDKNKLSANKMIQPQSAQTLVRREGEN